MDPLPTSGVPTAQDAFANAFRVRLVEFGALLRSVGVSVGPDEFQRALQATAVMGIGKPDFYWGLRATMIKRQEDLAVFDAAYTAFWNTSGYDPPDNPSAARLEREVSTAPDPALGPPDAGAGGAETTGASGSDDLAGADEGDGPDRQPYVGSNSSSAVIRNRSFCDYSAEDYLALRKQLHALEHAGPSQRRRRRQKGRRGVVDPARTVREGLKTGGVFVRPARRTRTVRPRRLILVCDVSGSMQAHALAFLTFAHVAAARRRVETFAFATSLSRITRTLLAADPESALTAAVDSVVDWAGGTRIGEALMALEQQHSGMIHGAVVVIASDGWERGDPDLVARATAGLRRRAEALIWLNPNLEDPRFVPRTRGMVAALPNVDRLMACHNFAALEDVVGLLNEL